MSKRVDHKSAARIVREQIAAEQRRKRTIWTALVAVFVLMAGGLIGWMLFLGKKANEVHTPASANKDGNGIAIGSGPVVVEDYIDFICPHCKRFHDEATPAIKQLIAENKVTFVTHPVAYLDRFSTNRYSTRASAAAGCAADEGKFNEYVDVLFDNQPAEGTAGPSDDQLIQLGSQASLGEPFAQCVKEKRHVTWAKKVSEDAAKAGVTGTPTVFVNGRKIQGGAASIIAAVAEASAVPPTPSAS